MEEKTEEIIETVQTGATDEKTIYKEIKDPYGFIYITTNLMNGKRYLGQKGFSQSDWKTYLGSGTAFKSAVEKYGKENFSRNIVHICYSEEELNQVEYDLSVFLDVVESPEWYNLVLGGGTTRGWHPTEATRQKIGNATKERLSDPTNHPRYGKPGLRGENNPQFGISPKDRMDEETYKRWYESHKSYWANPVTKGEHIWKNRQHPSLGTHLSDEKKENLSIKAKERFANPANHPMYGKNQTDIAKAKMSNAHKLRNINKGITVYSLSLNRIFCGATEAAKEFNLDPASITSCCKGKQSYCGINNITGEKMIWMYAIDAIKNEYLLQKTYDIYVENIKKEIDSL